MTSPFCHSPPVDARPEQGFTLVEVLIASAILMVSIGVLMQLFASGLDRMHRSGAVAHLLATQRVIVHRLDAVNPALRSEGSGQAEGLRYRWKASIEEPYRRIYDASGVIRRDLALFAIRVELDMGNGDKRSFICHRLGWKLAS